MFLYKDKLFQQIDDVAMGLSLGHPLANIFLAKMEKKIMSIASVNHPLLYLGYVDDIFAVFETNESYLKVFRYFKFLTQKHKIYCRIWFRTDVFLDLQIKVKEDGCDTWTWRKTTYTNLLLNFDYLCPLKWKFDLKLCLLNGAKAI